MQYPHQGNKQAFVEMHYLEVKSKIHLTKLEHGLDLCRCLDIYGEVDLNPIQFTCVTKIRVH